MKLAKMMLVAVLLTALMAIADDKSNREQLLVPTLIAASCLEQCENTYNTCQM